MLELLAIACSGTFAGAALYISAVQHPAAREAGDATAAAFFPPMYRRAAPMQGGLAVVGSGSALIAWISGAGPMWLLGAVLLGSVVPFTLLVIKPVNDQLLADDLDAADPRVTVLLERWGQLHGIRTMAGAASFLTMLLG